MTGSAYAELLQVWRNDAMGRLPHKNSSHKNEGCRVPNGILRSLQP